MRWSVGQRLVLSFLLMTILMAGVGAFSVYNLSLLNTNMKEILQERQPVLADMAAIESGVLFHSLKMEQYVTTGNKTHLSTAEGVRSDVETRLAKLEASTQGTEDQQLVREVREAYNTYASLSDEMQAFYALNPGKTTALESRQIRIAAVLGNTVLAKADALYKAEQNKAQELIEANSALYLAALRITVASTLILTLLALALSVFISRSISVPIDRLVESTEKVASGDLAARAQVTSDEIGALASAFNAMAAQLQGIIETLEQRVAARTLDLERQSAYLEASVEVGRAATSILEIDRLIEQVVELIRERFGLYYVGLFLVDDAVEWAVLHAGTGEAGRAMLARGHRLKIGGGSMIGWSVANAQARIALEAGEDAVRLATAELPDTRSEAALPLRSRGRVLGAVTVQSSWPGAFDETIIAVLQSMADQVAVALDNARLFAESQAAVETMRHAYGAHSREGWAELLRTHTNQGYRYAHKSVTPVEGGWGPELLDAIQAGEMQESITGEPTLAVPLKVRDQLIGALRLRKGADGGNWTAEEMVLVETLAEQLSLALESARLYQDTQRRAARERLVNEITARIRSSMSLEAVLNSAVREISQLVDANYAAIDLELGKAE